ncbi:MAG: CHAP domain-containing protein [Bacteroidetes bacterium]|nr:CHAP domain-containing protein [Bacteroidota bacterium]
MSAQTKPIAQKILSFCDLNKGKKVGKGECWDLAKEALNSSGATWKPPYVFGKQLTKKETVLPGDIIQFEKVTIKYPDGSWKELPHHTAIVYSVVAEKKYLMAEQNANGKRFVTFAEIDLSYVKKGTYTVYRPQ